MTGHSWSCSWRGDGVGYWSPCSSEGITSSWPGFGPCEVAYIAIGFAGIGDVSGHGKGLILLYEPEVG